MSEGSESALHHLHYPVYPVHPCLFFNRPCYFSSCTMGNGGPSVVDSLTDLAAIVSP